MFSQGSIDLPQTVRSRVLSACLLLTVAINLCGPMGLGAPSHAADPARSAEMGSHPMEHHGARNEAPAATPSWMLLPAAAETCPTHPCCSVLAKKSERRAELKPERSAIAAAGLTASDTNAGSRAFLVDGTSAPPGCVLPETSTPLRL